MEEKKRSVQQLKLKRIMTESVRKNNFHRMDTKRVR